MVSDSSCGVYKGRSMEMILCVYEVECEVTERLFQRSRQVRRIGRYDSDFAHTQRSSWMQMLRRHDCDRLMHASRIWYRAGCNSRIYMSAHKVGVPKARARSRQLTCVTVCKAECILWRPVTFPAQMTEPPSCLCTSRRMETSSSLGSRKIGEVGITESKGHWCIFFWELGGDGVCAT